MKPWKTPDYTRQQGLTLIGLLFALALLGSALLVAAKVTPTVTEYFTIKKAIESAKSAGSSVAEIQAAFNRQASVGYIDSISGQDLNIVKSTNGFDVSFAYPKKINLVGPVSLLIEYEGSTATNRATKSIQ